MTDENIQDVECPVCHQLVEALPDIRLSMAMVSVHGTLQDFHIDCDGSLARVPRPI